MSLLIKNEDEFTVQTISKFHFFEPYSGKDRFWCERYVRVLKTKKINLQSRAKNVVNWDNAKNDLGYYINAFPRMLQKQWGIQGISVKTDCGIAYNINGKNVFISKLVLQGHKADKDTKSFMSSITFLANGLRGQTILN